MIDLVVDLLICLCNVNLVYYDFVILLLSKLKMNIVQIFQQEGYIVGWEIIDVCVGKNLMLMLKYGLNCEWFIVGIKCVFKFGFCVYVKFIEFFMVFGGFGVVILFIFFGFFIDCQVEQKGVGGEVFVYVW